MLTQSSDTGLSLAGVCSLNGGVAVRVGKYGVKVTHHSHSIAPGMLKVDAGVAIGRENQRERFIEPPATTRQMTGNLEIIHTDTEYNSETICSTFTTSLSTQYAATW